MKIIIEETTFPPQNRKSEQHIAGVSGRLLLGHCTEYNMMRDYAKVDKKQAIKEIVEDFLVRIAQHES